MNYLEIVSKLSKELNIPEKVVDTAYKSFFSFMREVISNLPLKENLTEDGFNRLKTNFNLPALGKLHCTYERYLGMKDQKKYIKALKNYENQEN